jgi:hypothetical protein
MALGQVPLGRLADRVGILCGPGDGFVLAVCALAPHGFYAATDGVLMADGGDMRPASRRWTDPVDDDPGGVDAELVGVLVRQTSAE